MNINLLPAIILLFWIASLLGMAGAILYFSFHVAKSVLFDFLGLFQMAYEAILKIIKVIYDEKIKNREFIYWKKNRLPELQARSRDGVIGSGEALAERLSRSNHKRTFSSKDKKYDY